MSPVTIRRKLDRVDPNALSRQRQSVSLFWDRAAGEKLDAVRRNPRRAFPQRRGRRAPLFTTCPLSAPKDRSSQAPNHSTCLKPASATRYCAARLLRGAAREFSTSRDE